MIPSPTESPSILFQDEHILILHKPSYMYVHPPEDRIARKSVGRQTCIHWLTDHHDIYANPIHRLDFSTEGLLIFAKTNQAGSILNQDMRDRKIKKFYNAIVRGWFKEPIGQIDLPLELDSTGEKVDCLTLYKTLHRIEIPVSVHSKFPTSRYSWLDIELKTGRWHQIRRHMNRVAHPIIGDREHGDSHHNRYFREQLNISRLCLRAVKIEFHHPITAELMSFSCPDSIHWLQIKNVFMNSQFSSASTN